LSAREAAPPKLPAQFNSACIGPKTNVYASRIFDNQDKGKSRFSTARRPAMRFGILAPHGWCCNGAFVAMPWRLTGGAGAAYPPRSSASFRVQNSMNDTAKQHESRCKTA